MNHFAFGVFSRPVCRRQSASRRTLNGGTMAPQAKKLTLSFAASVFGCATFLVAASPLFGQVGPPVTTGRPTDWTHHRVVFSNPGTLAEADAVGKTAHVKAVLHNTRFMLQQMRQNPSARTNLLPGAGPVKDRKPNPNAIHKDWNVNISTGLVNPNAFPAKYSFSTTTFSCASDFVTFPTGIAGSGTTTATMIAYNQLYGTSGPSGTGCGAGVGGAAVPTILWEYNTAFTFVATGTGSADGSRIKTSPVLSLDGTQVAFIQVDSSNHASLVLLKPGTSSTVVALNTPSLNVAPASYRACTAPCMTRITLNGSPNDTWSAPFYDYNDDVLYVGDDSGKLHQFTNVFVNGTGPLETTSGYPVALGATILGSPVYDSSTDSVFVGSQAGVLYQVAASSGTLAAFSATLANNATSGIFDAPLVDSAAGKVYVFVGSTAAQTTGCTTAGHNCVYQFATNFTGSGTAKGSSQDLGVGGTSGGHQYLFDGDFDNVYYSSSSGTAGNLYVVGSTNASGGADFGTLYRISLTGGTMGTPSTTQFGHKLPPFSSPVTEFCNNGTSACVSNGTTTTTGTDYIFFSLANAGVSPCSTGTGCIAAYVVSTGSPVFSSSLSESYGTTCFVTGGIVVDNAIASGTGGIAGASEIYFLGLGGTATNLCGTAGTANLSGVQLAQ
jgi:hypothetical protein